MPAGADGRHAGCRRSDGRMKEGPQGPFFSAFVVLRPWKKTMLTHEQVREWFRYNKKTGRLTWAVQRRGRGGLTQIGEDVGCLSGAGYRITTLSRQSYMVHRIIWLYVTGSWPEFDIDHRNGIGTDNRWCNLRLAPSAINQENQRRGFRSNKSGLLGAWPSSDGKKWRSVIKVGPKFHFLGYFEHAIDAHRAYVKAKRKLHAGCTI